MQRSNTTRTVIPFFWIALFIFGIGLIIVFILWSESKGGFIKPKPYKSISYDSSKCINGEYCGFCDDKCICKFGWMDEFCDKLKYNDTWYPFEWKDDTSRSEWFEGDQTFEDCMQFCEDDPTCRAFHWTETKYCLPILLKRSLEETENGPPLGTCARIRNYENFVNPLFVVEYDIFCYPPFIIKRSLTNTIATNSRQKEYNFYKSKQCFLLQKAIESELSENDRSPLQCIRKDDNSNSNRKSIQIRKELQNGPMLIEVQEKLLYIKNGVNCFGYICYYNNDYGLVWIDSQIYKYITGVRAKITVDEFESWTQCGNWQDEVPEKMGNYSSLPSDLGKVLEITVSPYLQMKRIFETTGATVKSISVANEYGDMLKDINGSEYGYTYMEKDLFVIKHDYSEQYFPPEYMDLRYDTIILPIAMYSRQSLPVLLTNVYNLLNPDGIVIIRDQYWNYTNSEKLTNLCMGAGMVTRKFANNFMDLFTQMYYEEDDPMYEPVGLNCITPDPIPGKSSSCWNWDYSYEHPEHMGLWYSFIGKK